MAVLSDAGRIKVWLKWMRENTDEITGAMTKDEFRALVNAADVWANDNTSSYNQALPLPGRTSLSARQKALVLIFVISERFLEDV